MRYGLRPNAPYGPHPHQSRAYCTGGDAAREWRCVTGCALTHPTPLTPPPSFSRRCRHRCPCAARCTDLVRQHAERVQVDLEHASSSCRSVWLFLRRRSTWRMILTSKPTALASRNFSRMSSAMRLLLLLEPLDLLDELAQLVLAGIRQGRHLLPPHCVHHGRRACPRGHRMRHHWHRPNARRDEWPQQGVSRCCPQEVHDSAENRIFPLAPRGLIEIRQRDTERGVPPAPDASIFENAGPRRLLLAERRPGPCRRCGSRAPPPIATDRHPAARATSPEPARHAARR